MNDDMISVPILRDELKEVKGDVIEIKRDIKELLAVKHKVIGGLRVVAIAVSICGFVFGGVTALIRDNHSELLKMQSVSRDLGLNYCQK